MAKRSQERSERRPEVPRSGPWDSHEAARDAQGTVLKSPKSMQKQQKRDCGFQTAFRRILQRCWTTSAKLRHAFRIVKYSIRCNSHVWVAQNVCKAFGSEFGWILLEISLRIASRRTKIESRRAQNCNLKPSWTQEVHRERVCKAHAAKKSRRSRPRTRQEGEKHQVGQFHGRSVGDPWAIGGQSMEQVGGMTAAGGGGGRR